LCGATAASHPIGIGTHCRAVYAVSPIPVIKSSVADDRARIGSAPHHPRAVEDVMGDGGEYPCLQSPKRGAAFETGPTWAAGAR
jgi:hypothetical protein